MLKFQALIFDLGNVVIDYAFSRTFRYWAGVAGISYEFIRSNFQFGDEFEKFERGEIEPEQFLEVFVNKSNCELSFRDFELGWCQTFVGPCREIEAYLNELEKEYRLVALSNTNIVHGNFVKREFHTALSVFEKIFFSYEMRARKPEALAFAPVLKYLGLPANELVFVDDNPANVQAARKLGIQSVLADSPSSTIQILDELLGRC